MFVLIVSSLLLVFICAWVLSRPFRVGRIEQETHAQQGQYVLARDRLLQQLEQIDVQAVEGLLEKESAKSEIAHLEYELAGVLKQLDTASNADVQASVDNSTKLNSWLAFSGFSLFLLLGSFALYGSWQADTVLNLLSTGAAPVPSPIPKIDRSSATVPPEALAMVSRLEGKLAKNPDDGDGWKRLGRSYMVMRRYQEAVSAYSAAAKLLPDDGQIKLALQQLAEIANPQASSVTIADDALLRISQLEEKLAVDPDNAMNWARLGRVYLNTQHVEDAERAYARAYALDPGNVVILSSYAGIIFSKEPRNLGGQALELFKQLHAIAPEHPDGLWFLGLAAFNERDYERAIELWTKLLGILSPGSEGYAKVSGALSRAGTLSKMEK